MYADDAVLLYSHQDMNFCLSVSQKKNLIILSVGRIKIICLSTVKKLKLCVLDHHTWITY